MNPLIGYFDSPTAGPAYDPGKDCPCVVCMAALCPPMTTISLMADGVRDKSFFFRVHNKCWDSLTEEEQGQFESSVIDTHLNGAHSAGQQEGRK